MGRQRFDNKEEVLSTSKALHYKPNQEQVLEEAGQIINDLVHCEIEKKQLTDDPTSFNIESCIISTDPKL